MNSVAVPETLERVAIADLLPYANNARTHSDEQIAQLAGAIKQFGWTNPLVIDQDGMILAGHGRLAAARKLGMDEVPCVRVPLAGAAARAYILADNRLAELAGWDNELLRVELEFLREQDFDIGLAGFDDDYLDDLLGAGDGGDDADAPPAALADKFMIPPFTVLNAREGWWQDRKRNWLALGIKSEEGRASGMTMEGVEGRDDDFSRRIKQAGSTTSVFDPVVCELAYRWFSPPDGTILDPFSGGSVRGIVAAKLGRRYHGNDLRQEQIEANVRQWGDLDDKSLTDGGDAVSPVWTCGDSRNIDSIAAGVQADMVFSCPPYADLEVYSDDPDDLSTLGYEEFRDAYFEIIKKSCSLLKPNRFACFVVGEVRDSKGHYYDFVGDTVQAFRDAGLHYYNEAILVTAVGSLPIRAGKSFGATRKMGKTHQNILVFVKGDPKIAATECGDPMIPDVVFPAPEEDDMIICPSCGHEWIRGMELEFDIAGDADVTELV